MRTRPSRDKRRDRLGLQSVTQAQAREYVRASDFVMWLADDRRTLDELEKARSQSIGTSVAAFLLIVAIAGVIKAWTSLGSFDSVPGLISTGFIATFAVGIYKASRARTSNSTIIVLRQGLLKRLWSDADEKGALWFIPWSGVKDVREDEDGITLVLGRRLPMKIHASRIPGEPERGILVTLARSGGELPKEVRRPSLRE